MSNNYYTASGNPATGSEGLSSLMRAEFVSLQASFDLLPALTGNGGKAVVVNVGGTALTVTTGTLALAGNLSTTGAFNTTFAQGASVTLTLPVVTGTLATLAGTETLTNKTLVAPALGTPASGTLTNATGLPIATGVSGLGSGVATALAVAVGSAGAPVVNGGALGTPSSGVATNLTGTAASLTAGTATNQSGGSVSATTLAASGAVSGAGFTALFASPPAIGGTAAAAGAFTTLSATSTVSGAGFTAWAASPPSIGSTAPGTGAFTTLSASSTVSGTGFSTYLASPPAIGGSAAAAGSFTTLSASSTVSGAGMTARFASPGPIGSTAPGTGAFTTLSTTGVATSLTASPGTNTTQLATTAFATAADALLTPLAGHLFGLVLSNDGGTPNTVLDISAGLCANSTNGVNITLGAFTKSTGGTWAAGTGGNGMGTGLTIANSTWYHVFAIINSGTADVYFDTSVTAANKPASTTAFRRIGSFLTDGSAHIRVFVQDGDNFWWQTPITDVNAATFTTANRTLYTVSAPPGVVTDYIFRANVTNPSSSPQVIYTSPDEVDSGPVSIVDLQNTGTSSSAGRFVVKMNTSSQLGIRAANASTTGNVWASGYIDTRGRFS